MHPAPHLHAPPPDTAGLLQHLDDLARSGEPLQLTITRGGTAVVLRVGPAEGCSALASLPAPALTVPSCHAARPDDVPRLMAGLRGIHRRMLAAMLSLARPAPAGEVITAASYEYSSNGRAALTALRELGLADFVTVKKSCLWDVPAGLRAAVARGLGADLSVTV